MSLKNKRILITAGPTWVPIDEVRVISNTASGATGILLAQKLSRLGAKVTLVLGKKGDSALEKGDSALFRALSPFSLKGRCPLFKVIRFSFFDELKSIIAAELKGGRYDAVIHSAAVSDYKPQKPLRRKIRSGLKHLRLDLVPTEKIIDSIKKRGRSLYLVGFKFEPSCSRAVLIKEAAALAQRSRADLVVANTTLNNAYRAYFVKGRESRGPMASKMEMARQLCCVLKAVLK
ncbi:MAG: phosphopantothenoylcysteine decarboxylase [Candidatus Omnitrophota bacterium]|nr:phosphopantothenoylcysteine decarboxylase [Candidatus Omnitrophota bacterium]